MIEKVSEQWPFAVVLLQSKDKSFSIHSPAAFLFDTPDGFAWVAPKYKDPNGAGQHAFHRVMGTVTQAGDGFEFDGPEWSGKIEPYEPTVAQLESIGSALEWFESLELDLKKERRSLKRALGKELK